MKSVILAEVAKTYVFEDAKLDEAIEWIKKTFGNNISYVADELSENKVLIRTIANTNDSELTLK